MDETTHCTDHPTSDPGGAVRGGSAVGGALAPGRPHVTGPSVAKRRPPSHGMPPSGARSLVVDRPAAGGRAVHGADPLPLARVRTQVQVPLRFADGYTTTARVVSFDGLIDGREHLAFGLGDWARPGHRRRDGDPVPLVRPHSECLTGDVFGSERCDCGPQLREAVERIATAGGILLYLRQEGRGIGLYAKLDAYALQDTGLDTYQANLALGRGEDERDYAPAVQMLRALDVDRVDLLSNNPDKAEQFVRHGLTVAERVPTAVHLSPANAAYLTSKARHAHTLRIHPAS